MPSQSLVRSICVAIVGLASILSLVRAQSVEWIHQFPIAENAGIAVAWAGGLTVDPQGSIYVSGSVSGDLYSENLGDFDVYMAKFTANGQLDWGIQFGTPFDDRGRDIALDVDGQLILVGSTRSSLFGDAAGHWDGYVAQYDTSGNELWGLQFGDEQRDVARRVAVDSSNELYVAGHSNVDTDRDDLGDGYLTKYDNDGIEIWHQEFTTSFRSELIAINSRDNIAFVTSDYEDDEKNTLRRLDVDGAELWSVDELDRVRAITMDEQGNTYITGGPRAARFLSKYDDSGQLLWTHTGSEAGGNYVYVQENGNTFVGGTDPREGSNQVFSEFDSNGNLVWTRSIDGLISGRFTGDTSGNFYYHGQDRRKEPYEQLVIKFNSQRLGDLARDEILDVADVDILSSLIQGETYTTIADFNLDDAVDDQDLGIWVTELKETHFGDANLDGTVDFADFLSLSAGFGSDGGWGKGDFDANGKVEFDDFIKLSANFGKSAPASASVPEPSAMTLTILGTLGLIRTRFRAMSHHKGSHS